MINMIYFICTEVGEKPEEPLNLDEEQEAGK